MCGRFVSLLSPESLRSIFGVNPPRDMAPRYNIAPTQAVPVVRQDAAGSRSFASLRWGLVPNWARDPALGSRMINARSETVHEKPAFRRAIRSRRCIVPAQGFYEWQTTTTAGKQPFYLSMRDGSPLAFAGIWETWQSPDGANLETFAILTTGANSLMAPIHDRMPVMLQRHDFDLWLDLTQLDPHELRRLYQPFPAELMQSWRVSRLVNSTANDSEECIRPLPTF
jgi:putative SOS response-associated peptidase YedK